MAIHIIKRLVACLVLLPLLDSAIPTLKQTDNLKTLMILRNNTGKQVYLDLNNSLAEYIDTNGTVFKTFSLPKFYHVAMHNLFLADAEMGQSMEVVLKNLTLVQEIKGHINNYLINNKFSNYAVGSRNKPAPTLEEILIVTPRLYGQGPDRLVIK